MKYQVLFSLKNNGKVFINVVCCSLIGALRFKIRVLMNYTQYFWDVRP